MSVFFGLILVGVPIGYVLGIAGVAGLVQIGGDNFLAMAGEIMNRSGITAKLAEFADSLVGYLRGGLAHSNMVASVLFAGKTGAAVSDAAAFGNTLVPAMVSKGYSRPPPLPGTYSISEIGFRDAHG